MRGWAYGRLGLVPAFGVATAELRLPLLASPGERAGAGAPPPSAPSSSSPSPSPAPATATATAPAAGGSADQTTAAKEAAAAAAAASTESAEPPPPSLWERVPSLTAVLFVDGAVTAEGRRLSSVAPPTAASLGLPPAAAAAGGAGSGSGSGGGARPVPPLTTLVHRGAAVGVGLHVAGAVGVDVAWPSSGGRAALSFRLLDRTF